MKEVWMSTAAETSTPTRTTWKIDPAHSQVEFAVRHLMITTVRGRFNDVKGSVVTEGDDPNTAQVDVIIDVSSIDTRDPHLDAHLNSADFFNVQKNPYITSNTKTLTDL